MPEPLEAPCYVIGIDLGTTNSALAFADLNDDAARRAIRVLDLPQVVAPGELARRPVLPSFLYLPGGYDLPAGSLALPWDPGRPYVVGEFARDQGARVPGRLVASAKSWLSHSRVDRTAPILPWGAAEGVPKVSPVTAGARYLQHMAEAWDALMAQGDAETRDGRRFAAQSVVLTVPASFDEVARELTLAAAHDAGLGHAVLLEEPLAAFYAWLARHEADWQQQVAAGQIILVVDVGGGTTDFTLIGIRAGTVRLRFDRLAVGEHLLLGGDNMDYTLGRHLEAQLFGRAGALDAQRWHQLVHECRQAKETLLGSNAPDQVDITVVGAGGGLIAGTRKGVLHQEEVQRLIVDGFFPMIGPDERPAESHRIGLAELGLPYVQDPAISRHLAAFWRRFEGLLRQETGRAVVYPDFVLFNGGALTPPVARQRLVDLVAAWFAPAAGAGWRPQELPNPHPELAVARGAAYYGLVRHGKGVRVGSGSPRAYYVGVTPPGAMPDGLAAAVCLAPRGVEEGFRVRLEGHDFEALANQPVMFQIYASSTRVGDQLGDIVHLTAGEVTELPPIRTVLRFGRRGAAQRLPVQIGAHLTEVGTLELWCEARQTDHRWQLQFDARQGAPAEPAAPELVETVDQAAVESAQAAIATAYSGEQGAPSPGQLRRALEDTLALDKESWPTPLIRTLADALLDAGKGRAVSPEHEVRWLNLLGWCLRPGFGDPVDEWRIQRVWKLFFEGPAFPRQAQNRTEWWILWRRAAGGLKPGQQVEVFQLVRPYIQPVGRRKTPRGELPKHIGEGELLEIWMMLANLERLPAETKVEIGRALLASLGDKPSRRELWALSRIGARSPVYGTLDRLIPAAEAARWVDTLLKRDLEQTDSAAQALVLLARTTGDRARDVPEATRHTVAAWLAQLPHAARWQELLDHPERALRREEQEWIIGDTLPSGLVLQETAR